MGRINVAVSAKIHHELKKLAFDKGMSLTELTEAYLRSGLARDGVVVDDE